MTEFTVDVSARCAVSETSDYSMTTAFKIQRLGDTTLQAALAIRKSAMYEELPVGSVIQGNIHMYTLEDGTLCRIPFTITRQPDGEPSYVELIAE
jgi:hypothetical protein